jgi:hypothetical protein
MTKKPVDALADANRALGVALAVVVGLAVVAVGITGPDAQVPDSRQAQLSASPLPIVPGPEGHARPGRDAAATRAAEGTTTTLREVALGNACLAASLGPLAVEPPTLPPLTVPPLTLPPIPFPTARPPETTTVPAEEPSTTAPPTTDPPSAPPPATLPPVTVPPAIVRPGPTSPASPPQSSTIVTPGPTPPTPTTTTFPRGRDAPAATRTRNPNVPTPSGSVRVLGAQLVCKP